MKYIDAELLLKEIERHLERATAEQEKFPDMPKYRWYLREGKKELCNDLLDYMYDTLGVEEPITDSLQQEQPEVFDTVAFQKGVQEGRRLEREDALTIADIEKFRREAAKDFTVALVSSGSGLNPKTIAYAIEMADELIKQLKEK